MTCRALSLWLCSALALVPVGQQPGPTAGAPTAGAPTTGAQTTGAPTTGAAATVALAVAEYQAGRYAEAYAAYAVLGAEANAPSAEVRLGLALAAVRVQRTGDAEAALRPLLDGGVAPEILAEAQFVSGLAFWQRAERAEAAAQLQDAEPFALASAQRAAAQALGAFCAADRTRGGWPAALRNAERAARLGAALEQLAVRQPPNGARQEPDAPPPPEPEPPRPEAPDEAPPELVQEPLSAAAAAELLLRVQQREREKLQVRRAGQRRAGRAGERDW
ncbi:MAG: hypothetical protein JNK49_11885 [Planctomycetes bacterium]|nr:hypothetical protein [Planctomycetota bacterium]